MILAKGLILLALASIAHSQFSNSTTVPSSTTSVIATPTDCASVCAAAEAIRSSCQSIADVFGTDAYDYEHCICSSDLAYSVNGCYACGGYDAASSAFYTKFNSRCTKYIDYVGNCDGKCGVVHNAIASCDASFTRFTPDYETCLCGTGSYYLAIDVCSQCGTYPAGDAPVIEYYDSPFACTSSSCATTCQTVYDYFSSCQATADDYGTGSYQNEYCVCNGAIPQTIDACYNCRSFKAKDFFIVEDFSIKCYQVKDASCKASCDYMYGKVSACDADLSPLNRYTSDYAQCLCEDDTEIYNSIQSCWGCYGYPTDLTYFVSHYGQSQCGMPPPVSSTTSTTSSTSTNSTLTGPTATSTCQAYCFTAEDIRESCEPQLAQYGYGSYEYEHCLCGGGDGLPFTNCNACQGYGSGDAAFYHEFGSKCEALTSYNCRFGCDYVEYKKNLCDSEVGNRNSTEYHYCLCQDYDIYLSIQDCYACGAYPSEDKGFIDHFRFPYNCGFWDDSPDEPEDPQTEDPDSTTASDPETSVTSVETSVSSESSSSAETVSSTQSSLDLSSSSIGSSDLGSSSTTEPIESLTSPSSSISVPPSFTRSTSTRRHHTTTRHWPTRTTTRATSRTLTRHRPTSTTTTRHHWLPW